MLKLLESHEIPFAQEGEIIYPIGTWSLPAYQDKTYKVIETQPTTYILPVNADGVTTGNYVLPPNGSIDTIILDASLEPNAEGIINQVRVGLAPNSSLAVYVRYLSGNIRGGLQKGPVSAPVPSNALLRYLGGYRHFHTPADKPRLQLWWTMGKTPAFALANWSGDYEKAVLFFTIQKMRIRETRKSVEEVGPEKGYSKEYPKLTEFAAAVQRGTRMHYLYSDSTMTI